MKTIRDIKTISGRADRGVNAYMSYMQITCLEMEKARKGRERTSALQRLQILNARLQQIESEKGSLLQDLARRNAAAGANGNPAPLPSTRRGLRVRY